MRRGLLFDKTSQPRPSRSSAPGLKFSTRTSDLAISSLNNSLPRAVFRLSVRLRLLALNSRKKRLSLSGRSRMLRRAMSPPLGSSSLITSAPRKPRICAQAGPAWLWVMSITRMPDSALSMLILLGHVPLDFRIVIGVVPPGLPFAVDDRRPSRRVAGAGAGRQALDQLVKARPQEKRDRIAVPANRRHGAVRRRFEPAVAPAV